MVNETSSALSLVSVPCCDICCPHLLDLTRPGKPPVIPRQAAVKRGVPNTMVQDQLHEWRTKVHSRDYSTSLFAAPGLLADDTVDLLSSVGPCISREFLSRTLVGQWMWESKYGGELYELLASLNIPPMVPLPAKPRGKKRAADGVDEGEVESSGKRRANGLSNTENGASAERAVTTSSRSSHSFQVHAQEVGGTQDGVAQETFEYSFQV